MYKKTFSIEEQSILEPISKSLLSLPEGQGLPLSVQSSAEVSRLRNLIYSWLSPAHSGLKSQFRLSQIGNTLYISRIPTITKISVSIGTPTSSSNIPTEQTPSSDLTPRSLVQSYLLEATSLSEAKDILSALSLSPLLYEATISEFKRHLGE